MGWRDTLIKRCGPGLLGGATLGDWWGLLRENGFCISPRFWPRAASIWFYAPQNSCLAWLERRRYSHACAAAHVAPPLFLLGHWRQGTTHLHNLFGVDERFAYPSNYQVFFPHTCLTTEWWRAALLGMFFPKRRPMDNIEWTVHSPQEDEFALMLLCGVSPYLAWVFPRQAADYDRCLTLRGEPPERVARWKEALLGFVRKLSFKHGRPLVLKSPTHTARVKLLLEMFPEARFIHIRRHPYAVYPSTVKQIQVAMEWHQLQTAPPDFDLGQHVTRQYRVLYDAYFEERSLIPAGRLHEMSFEDLERDPIGQMRSAYAALDLPDFAAVEPALRRYVASIAGYQKNTFPELAPEIKNRLAQEWRRSFAAWGYAT